MQTPLLVLVGLASLAPTLAHAADLADSVTGYNAAYVTHQVFHHAVKKHELALDPAGALLPAASVFVTGSRLMRNRAVSFWAVTINTQLPGAEPAPVFVAHVRCVVEERGSRSFRGGSNRSFYPDCMVYETLPAVSDRSGG